MNDLDVLIRRKVTFHCSRRGGEKGMKDFKVVHSLSEPLSTDKIPDWVTPSLLSIYKRWNGLKLFQPGAEVDEGFKLFSLDEVSGELNDLREIIEENIDLYEENSDFKDLDLWLNGLIPIAEIMSSGNKFALDTYHKDETGECPIVYLNHEAYYGDVCDPSVAKVKAINANDLLKLILNEPLKYLASGWVGGNDKEQWYPESISYA
jgi:hypothetical protein